MKNKILKTVISILIIFSLITCIIAWGNTALKTNTVTVKINDLSDNLKNFKIAHISDLHNANIGENNEKLLSQIDTINPHIIAITGDLIDTTKPDLSVCVDFLKAVVDIAPCYYVVGNHEHKVGKSLFNELEKNAVEIGIHVLRNENEIIKIDGEKINIIGIDDPFFWEETDNESVILNTVNSLKNADASIQILLSHRPEYFKTYVETDVDLVLSGHAHGGQFRLPFVGGLFAPHQGFFPEYDSGLYMENDTNMIVSRGIGNSVFPFRFANRPEIICVEFESK